MLSKLKLIFFVLRCIFLSEKKELKKQIGYLNFFIKNVNLIKYILFLFNRKDINPIKMYGFQEYINQNKKKWIKIKSKNINTTKSILVENFINQAAYGVSNVIIGKFLKNLNNNQLVGFIRLGDIKGEVLFRSFGINQFIYFKNKNFFQRIKYIFIALNKIGKKKNIKQFCKLKISSIDIGLPSYDSYIRYTGNPTVNKINEELVIFLADTIYSYDYFKDLIIKNQSIKSSIQSETAFSPLNIFFQLCLKNKIEVFSRLGTNSFAVRRYNNESQKYNYRANISQKIFDEIYKNFKSKSLKGIKKYYKKLEEKGFFGQDQRIRAKLKGNLNKISKKELINKFNWNINKKIGVFFFNHLIDVNFHSGPRTIFKDNYTWSNFMLNKMKNLNNINWIIKDHPSQPFYKSKLNFDEKVAKLCNKYQHIRYFPTKYDPSSLKSITNVAITSHGTTGIEYPSFGVPSIYAENSFYSNLNFTHKISNLKKLDYILKNLHKLKKPSQEIINKSKVFLYIRYELLQSNCSLLAPHDTSRQINENEFWINNKKRIKNFNFRNDEFYRMFKFQMKNGLRHTVNLNKLKIKDKKYNDFDEK
jgi:hypothetical protein